MLFAVFLGWVIYLTYNLYLKTKALRRKSTVVLINTKKSLGGLHKKLKIMSITLKSIWIYRQVKKTVEMVKSLSFVWGFISRKI